MDFTVKQYSFLLHTLIETGFKFIRFQDYFSSSNDKFVILRHDVDDRNLHSLQFAKIQSRLGIKGTYYFRMVPQSFEPKIVQQIASMGHEIGYHYETMDRCQGDIDKAYDEFCDNLEIFRKIVPVNTICMHGSPRSKFDNKSLWKKYNYRESGIIGEPYFDLDFSTVYYLTDTGRRWDGNMVSVRDKVEMPAHFSHLRFKSTHDIIASIEKGNFPYKSMFTFHPQRWTDYLPLWASEYIRQRSKNMIKKYFFVK